MPLPTPCVSWASSVQIKISWLSSLRGGVLIFPATAAIRSGFSWINWKILPKLSAHNTFTAWVTWPRDAVQLHPVVLMLSKIQEKGMGKGEGRGRGITRSHFRSHFCVMKRSVAVSFLKNIVNVFTFYTCMIVQTDFCCGEQKSHDLAEFFGCIIELQLKKANLRVT